jgi:ATP-dependent DNA ligase
VIDGEIVCLDPDGRSNFKKLLFRREWPFFYAFDLVALRKRNLRELPLVERKRRLRAIMPRVESRVLLMEHIEERGCDLFTAACERDLEGIVAKWRFGTYVTEGDSTSCLKIKNPRPGRAAPVGCCSSGAGRTTCAGAHVTGNTRAFSFAAARQARRVVQKE